MSNNKSETARQFGVSPRTVANIIKATPNFAEVSEQKKEEIKEEAKEWSKQFRENTRDSIDIAIKLGNKKILQALEGDENIEKMMDKILDSKLGEKEKGQIIKTLTSILCVNLKEISTYVGTLYDKQALENGDPTSRSDNMNKNIHDVNVKTKIEDYFA